MQERLAEIHRRTLEKRLGTGSAYLGKVWSQGHRCQLGWKGFCRCQSTDRTPFCTGKIRWVGIFLEYHAGRWPNGLTGEEDFAVIEAMTLEQFGRSGLTAQVKLPDVEQVVRFGPKGTHWWTLLDLALTVPGEERDSAIQAVHKIQRVLAA